MEDEKEPFPPKATQTIRMTVYYKNYYIFYKVISQSKNKGYQKFF